MKYLKRYTICLLANHTWARIGYPAGSDGESGGFFLRCQRCDKEDHDAGTVPRGAGGG
ncbi:MAG: hypothetical protein JOZ82_13945 [Marmoricola sp.]|nr:hypothetical protein [Marmoricola sp.]